MPIEIKELHIRVTVNTPSSAQPPPSQAKTGEAGAGSNKEALVAECVEQVLQILQNKGER